MNSRTLPILLVLLLALGGAWYLTRDEGKKEPAGPLVIEPFLAALDGVEPTTLIVKNLRDVQKRYAFDLGSRPWRMTSPSEDEADPAPLVSFLRQISAMERRLFAPADKVDAKMLADSGLEDPRGLFVLGTGTLEVEVWIGDEGYALMDAAGGQPLETLFVRMNGSIYLVPKGFDALLDINLSDLRNKLLFLADPKDIQGLRVRRVDDQGAKDDILIRRRRNGRFYLEKPYETPVNLQIFGSWLAAMLQVRVMGFMAVAGEGNGKDGPMGPVVERKPWMDIELETSGMHEKVELFKGPRGGIYAKKKGRPSLMVVDGHSFRGMVNTPPESLISTALWAWSPIQAWKVQVETASEFSETKEAQILVLENRQPQPGFKLISPRVVLADAERYNQLFMAMEKCRILGLAEGSDALEAKRLLAKPDVEIKLTPISGKGRPIFSIKIAKGKAGRYFGSTTQSKLFFVLDCPEFDNLGIAWWRYVQPLAFRYPPGRPILYIRFQRPGKEPLLARTDAKGWHLEGQPSEDMDEVFDVLRKLIARKVLGQTSSGTGKEALTKSKEVGTLEFFLGPPEKEEGPVATLKLHQGEQKRLLAVNGQDELVYLLRTPDARDLLKVLER